MSQDWSTSIRKQYLAIVDRVLAATPDSPVATDANVLAAMSAHVRYFGFYEDAFELHVPGIAASSIIDGTQGFTNVVWIATEDPTWLDDVTLATRKRIRHHPHRHLLVLPVRTSLDPPAYLATTKGGLASLQPYLGNLVAR